MYLLKKSGEYFNRYILGYRYDIEIKDYFKDPYRKAIQNLYEEGYPVSEEFLKIWNDYKSKYSPLNINELFYFVMAQMKFSSNISNMNMKQIIENKSNIVNIISVLLMMHVKSFSLQTEYENQIKILIFQSEILSKEIQRINPIYNAVIIRKMVKLLEERIISCFISYFDVENYTPNIDLLKKYKNSLDKYKFYDLSKKIEKEILIREKESKKKENREKERKEKPNEEKKDGILKPRIKYLVNNKITKIQKTLHRIREYCNSIVHFDPSKEAIFNLDESFLEEMSPNIKEKDNNNIINESQQINKSFFVNISKVIDYIAKGNISNNILIELSKLKEDYETENDSIKNLLKKDKMFKGFNKVEQYEKRKKEIILLNNSVTHMIEKEKIPEFLNGFKKEKIGRILEYIKSNKYDNKIININNCNKEEKNCLLILNRELNKLDLYSRIKLNLNFENDLELLDLKKQLEETINSFKASDNYIYKIKELKKKFKEKYDEIKKKISLIDDCLIIFDHSKLFKEISV